MALNEQDRQRLDGIVDKMRQNNEPDDAIQMVVNDFKGKYDKPPSPAAEPFIPGVTPWLKPFGGLGQWAAKEAINQGPMTVGAMTGARLGAPLGLPGVIGGAGLGAGLMGIIERLVKTKPTEPTVGGQVGQVAGDVFGGAFQEAGPAMKEAYPAVNTAGQVTKEVMKDLYKSIKPTASKTDFKETLRRAIPEINKEGVIKTWDDMVGSILSARKRILNQYAPILAEASTGKSAAGVPLIDGNKIADDMIGVMDKRFIMQNPEKAAEIRRLAEQYRRPMSLEETEEFLKSANAQNNAYYKLNKTNRRVALQDPATAFRIKEADALRREQYAKLDLLPGPDASRLKKTLGALTSLEEEVYRRMNVAERQDEMSLAEKIGIAQSVGRATTRVLEGHPIEAAGTLAQPAAAMYMEHKKRTLLEDAMEKFNKGGLVGMPNSLLMRLLPILTRSGTGSEDRFSEPEPPPLAPEAAPSPTPTTVNFTPEQLTEMGYKKVNGGWQKTK